MPYIKESERYDIRQHNKDPMTPGHLNYLISMSLFDYWLNSKQNYQAVNDIIGALEACKLEFYRRVVVPYEEMKIRENGDVY